MKERKNGITLIALVITIIVLLILAGVAVSIGLNGDNIFERANQAKKGWNAKAAEEEDVIWNALNEFGITKPVQKDGDNPTAPTSITANAHGEIIATGGTDVSSGVAGYEYSLDQITWTKTIPELTGYKIGEEKAGEKPAWGNVADVKTETSEVRGVTKERKAPIPIGFTASSYSVTGFVENSIENGLVIYEGTEAVDTGNHDNAMTSRNQFVWIPVDDINDMVMCTGSNIEETVRVYVRTVDATGNVSEVTSQEITITGMQSKCNIVFDKTDNLVCSVHMTIPNNTNFLCSRLYGDLENFGTQNPINYQLIKEPEVASGDSLNSIKNESGDDIAGSYDIIKNEFKRQFNAMTKSVAMYGGFYVGRYEAGYDNVNNICTCMSGTPATNILNAGNNSSSNLGGVENWYGLYNALIRQKTDVGVIGQMIWGCQWDQVMKFVNKKKDGSGDTYNVTQAKTTSGKTRHTNSAASSGANINDLVQNIYDLEGNFYERTMAAYDIGRANRGGYYRDSNAAASQYQNSPTSSGSLYSSRQALFVIP